MLVEFATTGRDAYEARANLERLIDNFRDGPHGQLDIVPAGPTFLGDGETDDEARMYVVCDVTSPGSGDSDET
ncbi:MAG: hypothetical protein ACR652_23150 [Methylocystis sp.]|uniref:hypothetical protein n=1 Tax=Methylocystis sp. TaxID=1911079 RepID=UPI003DA5EDB5